MYLHRHDTPWVVGYGVTLLLMPSPLPFSVTLQIVAEADKVYGVMHANRISQIDVISKADALGFLQAEEEHAAAGGAGGGHGEADRGGRG